ncbi:flagellar hook assembly protein FlgD [Erythrobacter sp.]|jgi:flagellar basal-body rod modification protein FlgD|uniref:flagellar hook assembly protein FlgD n=1 Tax=Erythrobacter sp. TaxID=1042 RepID=UPI002E9B2E75|nr:flagellar hook capping FlgD N-terminal domain-containing protein [Erythrobacter sp.]
MNIAATAPVTGPATGPANDLPGTLDRLNAPSTLPRQSAAAALDATDFLRLMTAQLANQDPLEPQSNEQMLAQLAQFSGLESEIASRATLEEIAAKLDALIAAQEAANAASPSSPATPEQT